MSQGNPKHESGENSRDMWKKGMDKKNESSYNSNRMICGKTGCQNRKQAAITKKAGNNEKKQEITKKAGSNEK